MAKASLYDEALAKTFGLTYAKSNGVTVLKPAKGSKGPAANPFLKGDIKMSLRVLDEQDAVHRYEWFNLPPGLDSELVERMLYYRGQLVFFYMDSGNQFFMLPYGQIGVPDVYGRYLKVTPMVFGGTNQKDPETGKEKAFMTGFERQVCWQVPDDPKKILKLIDEGSVIVRDYTPQLSGQCVPRADMMDGVLDMMAECFPMARTALIANCGVKGMRVQSEDAKGEVQAAAQSVYNAAMSGNPWIPVLGMQDFQELGEKGSLAVQDYLLDLQSLDNFRLSLHGLSSGGLFQKKTQLLEGENEMNATRAKAALLDGLSQRQRACDLINEIWGIGVSVEISEAALAMNGQEMPLDSKGGTQDGQQDLQ